MTHTAKNDQHRRLAANIRQTSIEALSLIGQRFRSRVVALHHCQYRRAPQRFGGYRGREALDIVYRREQSVQLPSPLAQVPPRVPEAPEGARDAQPHEPPPGLSCPAKQEENGGVLAIQ